MYLVLYDKKQIFKGSNNECFRFLLSHQGNSVHHACKYEGYEIVEDKPESCVQYALTGGPGENCIANGNTWHESKIKGE